MRHVEIIEHCSPPRTGKKNSKGAMIINGKARVFNRKESVKAEQNWHEILKPHQIDTPLEGPLKLVIELTFPLTKKDLSTKALRSRFEGGKDWIWSETRPDAGNLGEAIQDVLTRLLFYKDDSHVVDLRIKKMRGKQPGIRLWLQEIEEHDIL